LQIYLILFGICLLTSAFFGLLSAIIFRNLLEDF
jgi:hypothetical protein